MGRIELRKTWKGKKLMEIKHRKGEKDEIRGGKRKHEKENRTERNDKKTEGKNGWNGGRS
jgi:hypothetical protein